ncbi:MAG TPA: FecR domain-containing protein [Chitinophagaceae bacterium]|nr:FecR domain-containing protein [Chitinophagaceae bacterium]
MSNTQTSRLKYLLDQFATNSLTEVEFDELFMLIGQDVNEGEVKAVLAADLDAQKPGGYDRLYWAEKFRGLILSDLRSQPSPARAGSVAPKEKDLEKTPIRRIFPLRRWDVAASIILLLGVSSYLLFFNKPAKQAEMVQTQEQRYKNDVDPGKYKARLTLADGSTITLDSAALGELAKQGNTSVINKDGQLVYNPSSTKGEVLYNTVSTNKGETYSLTLADGSKVWLNSGSSIHFPVAFPGKERRIETTGEVYVKVAPLTAKGGQGKVPFIVSVNGMEVLALGTEFNINSYSDEDNISTTLIEGSLKVTKGTIYTVLKPGQQTILNSNGQLGAATTVNIDEIVAWKEGFFHFESADLKTILRQFSRWYDIDVVYEGPVTNRTFFGIIKRSNTLKKVLEMLQDNKIEFRIESLPDSRTGKKLIVKSE